MKRTGKEVLFVLRLCLLAAATVLTMILVSPPSALPTSAPSTDFSAARAMQHLRIIAREPRPMGVFSAHAQVRDYLLDEIRALGLEPQVQDTFGVRLVHPGWIVGGTVENVLVRLPGTDPDGTILLIAHYDSTPGGPGAGDNGSGVVILLETLRALRVRPSLRHDVVFLFTDGHEPGIIGTHAFVAQHPWSAAARLVVNVDLRGVGPPVLAHNVHGNDAWIPPLAHSAPRPAYLSLPTHLFPAGENDLIPFSNLAGVKGVSIGSAALIQETHTAGDRIDVVSPGAIQQTGAQVLALVGYLGSGATLELGAPPQTFFPVLGRLVHYPSAWSVPLACVAGLLFAVALCYGFFRKRLTARGLGVGFLTFLGYLALAVGIATVLWIGIEALHPQYQYSPVRPHLSDDYLYAIGFFVLALGMAISMIAVVRKRITAVDLAAGTVAGWLLVVVAVTILVPATSYLATWVLLSGSLALLPALAIPTRDGVPSWPGWGFLVSAILATLLWVPVIYVAFLGPGFTMPWLTVGLVALWLGALLPALDWITAPKRWLLPATATLFATCLFVAAHVVVGRDSPPPLVNSIGYWLDAGSSKADWVAFIGGHRTDATTSEEYQVAFPREMDDRQARLLVDPIRQPYTEIFPAAPPFSVLTSAAPLLSLDGPGLEVAGDRWTLDRRIVEIKTTTSMHDRLYVMIPAGVRLLAMSMPDNERTELPALDGDAWVLRFDGMPVEGIKIHLETSSKGPIPLLLVEESTGLPSFPGLCTEPEPGTMRSPGEFSQGDATDFTAIYRRFRIPGLDGG